MVRFGLVFGNSLKRSNIPSVLPDVDPPTEEPDCALVAANFRHIHEASESHKELRRYRIKHESAGRVLAKIEIDRNSKTGSHKAYL